MTTYPYERIKDEIKTRIMAGEWLGEETRLPSSRDFAKYYHSSVNTVEKAIKELCAEGLLKRDNRRGTYIDIGLVSPGSQQGRSGLVAASVIGIDNPLWATALRGIEDVLHLHGYHLLSYSDDRNLDKLESLMKGAVAKKVDGVILSPIFNEKHEERNQRLYQLLQDSGIKVVCLDRHLYNSDLPYVTSDNVAGAYKLTKMLLEKGHRRILFIRNSDVSTFFERLLGMKQAFLEAGISFEADQDVLIPTTFENFEDELVAYSYEVATLIQESSCTAIFAANDQIAEAVIAATELLEMSVPQDISLVTYDALNVNRKLKLNITGVNQPFYDMGRAAAMQLMHELNGKDHFSVQGQICKADMHEGNTINTVK
ncbi:GntR family transcriptional regulator [Paenibacillus pectinilyticus]|uniref:GntR family transcriptional regulator n=1 Tax=Paenibacillus pectinilyticus TaxID=512399 RepID=A0A1C0ZXV8_9BACL|nr:GntR family transcriptional regulator [Paenibacillus pectinilyticus]OCT12934.1 GntR family transcriptional regulator [Paenibacillus pectinilyticus]